MCENAKLIRGDPPKIAFKGRESPLKSNNNGIDRLFMEIFF